MRTTCLTWKRFTSLIKISTSSARIVPKQKWGSGSCYPEICWLEYLGVGGSDESHIWRNGESDFSDGEVGVWTPSNSTLMKRDTSLIKSSRCVLIKVDNFTSFTLIEQKKGMSIEQAYYFDDMIV